MYFTFVLKPQYKILHKLSSATIKVSIFAYHTIPIKEPYFFYKTILPTESSVIDKKSFFFSPPFFLQNQGCLKTSFVWMHKHHKRSTSYPSTATRFAESSLGINWPKNEPIKREHKKDEGVKREKMDIQEILKAFHRISFNHTEKVM